MITMVNVMMIVMMMMMMMMYDVGQHDDGQYDGDNDDDDDVCTVCYYSTGISWINIRRVSNISFDSSMQSFPICI